MKRVSTGAVQTGCQNQAARGHRVSGHTRMCTQECSGFAVNSCAEVYSLQRRVRVFIGKDEILRLVHPQNAAWRSSLINNTHARVRAAAGNYLAVAPHDVVCMELRKGLYNGPNNLRRCKL